MAPSQTPDKQVSWPAIAYAAVLGVFGAVSAIVFMGVISAGDHWNKSGHTGWFDGHWWWVLVTTTAGVLVGLLRQFTRFPEKSSGLIEDLQEEHVDEKLVPSIVAISAVSLIGGASLGPEKALGSIGGGAAGWWSKRKHLDDDTTKTNTLAGFAGAYGGLFSSTLIVVGMIVEVARPGGRRMTRVLASTILASSISFAIYFAIAGAVFLDAYPVPSFRYQDWQLAVALGLGLFATVITTVLGVIMKLVTKQVARREGLTVIKATLGGLIFGVVGVALPLTMFTGSDQLKTVIQGAGTMSVALLVALLVAKIFTFSLSLATGFIGGTIFPALFLGGTSGVLVHAAIPSIPLGLAVSCMLAAVPGSLIAAPFTMVLLSAFLTEIGALQTAPVLIAVITSFLTTEAVKMFVQQRHDRRAQGKGEVAQS